MSRRVLGFLCLLFVPAAALGQYATDFEALNAAPDGVVLTGQDGFYLPPVVGSIDHKVYTYAGNTVGFPANPGGGNNFDAGTSGGGTSFARGQRDMTFSGDSWIFGGDVCGNFIGTLPGAQNLGSLSANQVDGLTFNFIMLAAWVDVNTCATWNANVIYFTDTNVQTQVVIPDAAFQNLPVQKWYRWTTQINQSTNLIEEIKLTDIDAGTTATYVPTGWYMRGGTAGNTTATCFRMFAGGSLGNVLGWDNLKIGPVTSCEPCDSNCDGEVDAFDIEEFIRDIFENDPQCSPCASDADGSGFLDAFDIAPFIDCLFGP